jgi:hypothetical protein
MAAKKQATYCNPFWTENFPDPFVLKVCGYTSLAHWRVHVGVDLTKSGWEKRRRDRPSVGAGAVLTGVGYLRRREGVPVGAGVVWMGSGDACVALAGGGRRSQDQDAGDASVPTLPPSHPRPYGYEAASEATP